MSLNKIELLVEKIDKAVSVINQLKSEKINFIRKIAELESKVKKLEEENLSLKKVNELKQKEIDQIDGLYEKLENKIEEILNFIEENDNQNSVSSKEEPQKEVKDTGDKITENRVVLEESEEDRIKKFVSDDNSSSNLFEEDQEELDDILFDSNAESEKLDSDNKSYEAGLFFVENEKEDINFYFDNDSKREDQLPKGIL